MVDFFSLTSEEKERAVVLFNDKFDKKDEKECWIWLGIKSQKGYGRFRTAKVWADPSKRERFDARAHRISWMIAHNTPIPPMLLCCHSCDVRDCVNPKHIFLGTPFHNMQDARLKGRIVRKKKEKDEPKKV